MVGLFILLLALYFYFEPEKKHLSVFFLFSLLTAGFQCIPVQWIVLPGLGIGKSYDWMLIFLGIIFCLKPAIFLKASLWKEFSHVKLFILVLLGLLFYSIYIQNIEPSISVRVFRNFIFIISIFFFCTLEKIEIKKVFRLIVYFTSFAAFLYCLQNFIHISLLNTVLDNYQPSTMELQVNNGIARYYNLPVYVVPVLFFLLFDDKMVRGKIRWLCMSMNGLAIVYSQHRNLLLSILVCLILYYVIRNRIGIGKLVFVSLLSFISLIGIDSMLGNRFSEGFTEMRGIFNNGLNENDLMAANMADMSTSEFRFYLFYERWNYVTKDLTHSLFGIGLVTEDSRVARSLRFNVGGSTDDTGTIAQVDTSDIAWAPLLIHFGIAGTIIFLSVYFNLLKRFYKYRNDKNMIVGFLFLISLFFTSFYGILMISQFTISLLMLFAAYHYRLKLDTPNE